MFSFFHIKKKVVVDCFTTNSFAHKYTPIIKSSKTIPDWWRKLPNLKEERNEDLSLKVNMKQCSGFLEYYKRGAIIQNWCNLYVEVSTDDGYKYYCSNGKEPDFHSREQFKGGFENFYHMKLSSPWFLRENKGYQFLFTGADWVLEIPIKVLPGVLDFKYNTSTHINIMIPKLLPFNFNIKFATPLVHIIPLRDDINFIFKNHLITQEELEKTLITNSNLKASVGGYNKFVKFAKSIETREKKCPFHF